MDLSEEEKEARLRAEEERLQNRMRNPGPASKVSSKPASKPFTFQSTGVNYGAPVNTSAGPNFKVQTNTNSLLNKYANDPAPQMAPTSTSSHSSSSSSSQIDILSDAYIQSPTLFDFKNLDQIFTIAIFAFVCQHGVPELLHLSGVPNRAAVKRAPFVMCATLALIFLLYNSLSITTVLYFGSEGFPSIITLEWTNYDGKCFGCESSAPGWAVFISYLIAIFPTITVSAAFPLSALTLSSTLDVVTCRLLEDSKYSWIIEKEWENRRRIVIRLIVIWPSFILGMFIKDYSTIIVWPGMFAFFISMIIPALLQIKSLQACTKIYGPEISKSPFYLRILSNPITAWCLIVFAICGLLYTIAMTIYGYTQ
eukprot:TRINITY_DN1036_c0_g1_i3.p1 TRINITY_DN1036_c0_g1~~TRINITY_DN1036_c0_g1_i3.p1  ORF type:complete len:367 (-),score=160.61 TRINITY_DN1036_c0_g1_i3:54-1154(-)